MLTARLLLGYWMVTEWLLATLLAENRSTSALFRVCLLFGKCGGEQGCLCLLFAQCGAGASYGNIGYIVSWPDYYANPVISQQLTSSIHTLKPTTDKLNTGLITPVSPHTSRPPDDHQPTETKPTAGVGLSHPLLG